MITNMNGISRILILVCGDTVMQYWTLVWSKMIKFVIDIKNNMIVRL